MHLPVFVEQRRNCAPIGSLESRRATCNESVNAGCEKDDVFSRTCIVRWDTEFTTYS